MVPAHLARPSNQKSQIAQMHRHHQTESREEKPHFPPFPPNFRSSHSCLQRPPVSPSQFGRAYFQNDNLTYTLRTHTTPLPASALLLLLSITPPLQGFFFPHDKSFTPAPLSLYSKSPHQIDAVASSSRRTCVCCGGLSMKGETFHPASGTFLTSYTGCFSSTAHLCVWNFSLKKLSQCAPSLLPSLGHASVTNNGLRVRFFPLSLSHTRVYIHERHSFLLLFLPDAFSPPSLQI